MESLGASVSQPADILFQLYDPPDSWTFDLQMWFDGRFEETSGSRGAGRCPEAELMQAALLLLGGGEQAHMWLDGLPGLSRLTFTRVWLGENSRSPMDLEQLDEAGCRVTWIDCDEATGAPTGEFRELGVVRHIRQFAVAALALGEFKFRGRTPPIALPVLRGAVNAVGEEPPGVAGF